MHSLVLRGFRRFTSLASALVGSSTASHAHTNRLIAAPLTRPARSDIDEEWLHLWGDRDVAEMEATGWVLASGRAVCVVLSTLNVSRVYKFIATL